MQICYDQVCMDSRCQIPNSYVHHKEDCPHDKELNDAGPSQVKNKDF